MDIQTGCLIRDTLPFLAYLCAAKGPHPDLVLVVTVLLIVTVPNIEGISPPALTVG